MMVTLTVEENELVKTDRAARGMVNKNTGSHHEVGLAKGT